MRRSAFGLSLLLAIPLLLSADTYTGKCIGVSDVDTISVMKSGRAVKIRPEGIDCPELGQDFGTRAKQFTSGMVFGKDVEVKEYNLDRYGRVVARVYFQGKDVSLELVRVGLAWHFKKYSSDPILAEAEEQARKAKTGLWSMPKPVPPWEYRTLHRRRGEVLRHVTDRPYNAYSCRSRRPGELSTAKWGGPYGVGRGRSAPGIRMLENLDLEVVD